MFELDSALLLQIFWTLIVLVGAFILVKVLNHFLNIFVGEKSIDRKRVINNVKRFIQIISYSIAGVLILWIFNVDVTGVVAGLGVGALVIGFALKDIIENWVSGLLIISGKTFKIGDVISVGNMKGVVTNLSLRTTVLKTYDRNEIIIPNSVLLKERIINLTGGTKETVASLVFAIDYIFEPQRAKETIRKVLLNHKNVVVNDERKREIRFLVKTKEWTTEIEVLFWITSAENEEFIKSEINESIRRQLINEKILPPLPALMRKENMEPKG